MESLVLTKPISGGGTSVVELGVDRHSNRNLSIDNCRGAVEVCKVFLTICTIIAVKSFISEGFVNCSGNILIPLFLTNF